LNQPLWSIQVEMWAILFLPAMVAISLRTSLRTDVMILVALSIVAKYTMYSRFAAAYPALVFVAYLNCFYLGVMLPKVIAISAVRALLSSGRFISALVIFQYWFTNYFAHTLGLDFAATLVIDALFAAALIGYALLSASNHGARILAWRPLVGLGDISYSLYAFGLPITTVCALLVLEHAPDGWQSSGLGTIAVACAFTGVALVVTTCVSWGSYHLIELPGIALGKKLTAVSRPAELAGGIARGGPVAAHGSLQVEGLPVGFKVR
jgi:peptidoglycan/LPS O-acetylase OafA/YrhL